jgi:CubicO group peptidase (beta-lactamase class C family)
MKRFLSILAIEFLVGYPLRLTALPVSPDTSMNRHIIQNGKAGKDSKSVLPDTPVGRQFGKWIEAFNSGDLEVMRRFVAEQWDPETASWMKPLENYFIEVYPDFRRITIERILYSSEYRLVTLGREGVTGQWIKMYARVQVSPPHRFTLNGLFMDAGPKEARSKDRSGEKANIVALREFLERQATADAFSGTVLVAKNDKLLCKAAYGWADRERKIPMRVDTRFNLASMGKMFTAIAICQLAEAGKLSFDDKVSKLLPEYPNKAVAEKVTIHHLLTHTSGMGDYFEKPEYEAAKERLRTPWDYIAFTAADPLAFAPGTDIKYSNTGFMVLGAIIERLSGQNYWEYVRQHIFRPAGMTNSGYNESNVEMTNLAIPYHSDGWNPRFRGEPDVSPLLWTGAGTRTGQGGPAGGGYSTVEDLMKFGVALRGHKLLGPVYTRRILTGEGERGTFGALQLSHVYGFLSQQENGEYILGHSGAYPGVSGELAIFLDRDLTVVSLSNLGPPKGTMPVYLLKQWLRQEAQPPRHTLTGQVRLHKQFRSQILPRARDVLVYLPPGYDKDKSHRYSVLYMQDGQNVFDAATADGGIEWKMDETAEALIKNKEIEPLIIVAVANAGEYRLDEYSPVLDAQVSAGGQADLYGRMLVEELKPFIDAHYRTLPDAAHTGLGGSSLGGLVSLYLGIKYPHIFGKLACLSSSVDWGNGVIVRLAQELSSKPALQIWLDTGTAEAYDPASGQAIVEKQRKFRDMLLVKGWKLDTDLKYFEAVGAGHEAHAWAERVGPFLRFLFPKR